MLGMQQGNGTESLPSGSLLFFKIIFYWLCCYSCPDFPPLPPPPSTPHYFRQSSYHCSCPWVVHEHALLSTLASPFPVLYFTSPWLFCNYLLVLLNPLTFSPIPPRPLPSGNHQNTLCVDDSVPVVLVCLVCFLHSIVDRYVFFAILLLIVLTSFFLNKSL